MDKYKLIAERIGELVDLKQEAYGDAFGKASQVLEILYPNGVAPEDYTDLLAVTRVLDKLFRIATGKDALGEDPWRDIAGYAILSCAIKEEAVNMNSDEDCVQWCIVKDCKGWPNCKEER